MSSLIRESRLETGKEKDPKGEEQVSLLNTEHQQQNKTAQTHPNKS
jgi:hypothetical protein